MFTLRMVGGQVPSDGTSEKVFMGIKHLSYASISILSSVGILMALLFLGFNIKFRNQKYEILLFPKYL